MTQKTDTSTMQMVLAAIRKMNPNEINMIVDTVKTVRKLKTAQEAAEYFVGQMVTFDRGPSRGGSTQGKIDRINTKSVSLTDSDGGKWRVHPSFING